jgi:hypothetical protein
VDETERGYMIYALERIPCELSIATDDGKTGCAWLGCKECARCLLLHALQSHKSPVESIKDQIMRLPLNGGYTIRPDLIRKT